MILSKEEKQILEKWRRNEMRMHEAAILCNAMIRLFPVGWDERVTVEGLSACGFVQDRCSEPSMIFRGYDRRGHGFWYVRFPMHSKFVGGAYDSVSSRVDAHLGGNGFTVPYIFQPLLMLDVWKMLQRCGLPSPLDPIEPAACAPSAQPAPAESSQTELQALPAAEPPQTLICDQLRNAADQILSAKIGLGEGITQENMELAQELACYVLQTLQNLNERGPSAQPPQAEPSKNQTPESEPADRCSSPRRQLPRASGSRWAAFRERTPVHRFPHHRRNPRKT